MKRYFKILCLLFFNTTLANLAFANNSNILKNRLNQVNNFYADFKQQVINSKGSIIQEIKGELWIKKPNLFNWHMTTPNENLIVSDGKTIWFYNPLLEQVTANWLENSTNETPLMLLINNSSIDWCQYKIEKKGDIFTLIPKSNNTNLKQVNIKVTKSGNIKHFKVVEQDGQSVVYELKNQKNIKMEDTKFHFTIPKGITLDDQRINNKL